MSKPYLLLYNLGSAAGWTFVLYQLLQGLYVSETGPSLWNRISRSITIVQSAAFLEILHSMFRLVRSPLLPTILQVTSRLVIIWLYAVPSNGIRGHWSLYLCFISWSLIEIVRYIYYAVALNVSGATEKINSLLFWLRYTLFMVLYPTGISGELFIMYNAWNIFTNSSNNNNVQNSILMRLIAWNFFLYLPLGPFMIINMWNNRKRAYKKRNSALHPRPLSGLIWPITNKQTLDRSTTVTNKAIWLASLKNVNSKIANEISLEKNWRFKYAKYVMKNVEVCCENKKNALNVAEDGLNEAYQLFEFKRNEKIISFKEAMKKGTFQGSYDTHIIKGNEKKIDTSLEIPYGGSQYQGQPYYLSKNDNTILKSDALREQLKKWVDYGSIESSAAESIHLVDLNKNKWLDLSDKYFVLLGATSAMGPLKFLLKHGANVIAIDLNRDFIWKKLFDEVKNSPGTLIFPIQSGASNKAKNLSLDELSKISGSDLLNNTPEIANWLSSLLPDKNFIIGNYTYLDGALHVQLALACDAIIKRLCEERGKNTSIAFLCTPTDNHCITKEAYIAAKNNYNYNMSKKIPFWIKVLNSIFSGKLLGKPNYKEIRIVKQTNTNNEDEKEDNDNDNNIYIVNGIVIAQGPNYALAKRLQHWRAVIQYEKGHIVSSNIAPSTATKSVVHNKQFEAAYSGMHYFKPMEIMYQETSNAVMGILLIHDICNPESTSNPNGKNSKRLVRNPFELFKFGSFNGGVWRCSHTINNIGIPSALIFYKSKYQLHLFVGLTAILAQVSWLANGTVFGYSPF